MRGHRILPLAVAAALFASASAEAQRDNLLCYKARAGKRACAESAPNAGAPCSEDSQCGGALGSCARLPKLPAFQVYLDDLASGSVGEAKTFALRKARQVCVPVDDHDRGIADASTHYVTYPIKQQQKVCDAGVDQGMPCKSDGDCAPGACVEVAKFDSKHPDNVNILVEDQFTNIRVDASKVDLLMTPASMCSGGDDASCLGTAAPAGEEIYKCYRARATRKVCAPGTPTALQVCRKDEDCPGGGAGACVKLDKLAKGLNTRATDDSGTLVVADPGDPNSPERTFALKSITHLCKAVEATVLPGGAAEGPVDSKARLLCYKAKASRAHCSPSAPQNALGPCSKEAHCGGSDTTSFCTAQATFTGHPAYAGLYLNDRFDPVPGSPPSAPGDFHRLDLGKEEMMCVPACEDPDDAIQFTPHVFRLTSLVLPPSGHPGQGLDLDNNPATCGPSYTGCSPCCSGGIDNWLGLLSGFIPDVNTALAGALLSGSIHILLEIDDLANGPQLVNGYQGDLDPDNPGCTNFNSGSQVCNYVVDGVDLDNRVCKKKANISFPVTVSNLPSSPAQVVGGGPESSFTLSVPVFGTQLALTARYLHIVSSVVHSGGVVSTASGILGGAIVHRELKQTILALPDGLCEGGGNNNEPCSVLADCPDTGPGTNCDTLYLGGIPKAVIAAVLDGIPRDIDTDGILTCEGGSNNGEPCIVPGDCPDPSTTTAPGPIACDPNDGTSIAFVFSGIDAAISGHERSCNLPTCSLK